MERVSSKRQESNASTVWVEGDERTRLVAAVKAACHRGTNSYPGGPSCRAEFNLALLDSPGGAAEGLGDVFALEVWVVREEFFGGVTGGNLADDHAYGDLR